MSVPPSIPCTKCKGRKTLWGKPCRVCKGIGTIADPNAPAEVVTPPDLLPYVGKRYRWQPDPRLEVFLLVEILRARRGYGRMDVEIKPLDGVGSGWIRFSSLLPL